MEEKYMRLAELTHEYQEKLDELLKEYENKARTETGLTLADTDYVICPHIFTDRFSDNGKTLDTWRMESLYEKKYPDSRRVNRDFRLDGVTMTETKPFDGERCRVINPC